MERERKGRSKKGEKSESSQDTMGALEPWHAFAIEHATRDVRTNLVAQVFLRQAVVRSRNLPLGEFKKEPRSNQYIKREKTLTGWDHTTTSKSFFLFHSIVLRQKLICVIFSS